MNDFGAFLAGYPALNGSVRAPNAVKETAELQRIRDAPWQPWNEAGDIDAVIAHYTARLRVPGGSRVLRPIQAATLALMDARARHGLGVFAPVPTGGGKTDTSLTVAAIVNAQRPHLFVPASLREKTLRNAQDLARHYLIRPLRVVSYESLSLAKNADALLTWKPDLMICDEAHMLKDSGGARWKRIQRYRKFCKEEGLPPPVPLLMSGSFTSRSLREYWHLLMWALGAGCPLPRDMMEMALWGYAIDEKVPDGARVEPGALMQLAAAHPDDPADALACARVRYGRRLLATPGVVGFAGDLPSNGLQIKIEKLDPTPAMQEAVTHLRSTWETPCGLPFETAMDLWRHEREVSCGLYYRWKYQPPTEWLVARKAWSAFVRHVLSDFKRWDTPLQVAKAVHDGLLPQGVAILAEWQRVEPMFRPETEPVWICDSTLRFAAEWLEKERGICWVQHIAFGRELEARTGVPYFQQEGKNKIGVGIDMHDGPAIASIASCSRGFDLQGTPNTRAKHWKNLIITTPTKNAPNEQLLSRTHRSGQEQDDVFATYVQRLEGDTVALAQACADAEMVSQTFRQPQRLSIATWLDA